MSETDQRVEAIGDRPFPSKEQQAELLAAAETIERFTDSNLDLGPKFEMNRRALEVAAYLLRDAAIWAQCMTEGAPIEPLADAVERCPLPCGMRPDGEGWRVVKETDNLVVWERRS